jgi:hypothetical protein
MYDDLTEILTAVQSLQPRIERLCESQSNITKDNAAIWSKINEVSKSLHGGNEGPGVFESLRSIQKDVEILDSKISKSEENENRINSLSSRVKVVEDSHSKISKGLMGTVMLVITTVIGAVLKLVL